MVPTVFRLQPDFNAAAYLIEIMIAELLFLGPYRKRASFLPRYIATGLLLLVIGTLTGIPTASFPRFLWFFAAMAGCITAVIGTGIVILLFRLRFSICSSFLTCSLFSCRCCSRCFGLPLHLYHDSNCLILISSEL